MESSNVGLESLFVVECSKLVALALVELVLELDPVEAECVEVALYLLTRCYISRVHVMTLISMLHSTSKTSSSLLVTTLFDTGVTLPR